jgi:hypothetical protein
MGYVLRMEKQQQLQVLMDLGWSDRAIARETVVDRKTVARRASCESVPRPASAPSLSPSPACPPVCRAPFPAASHRTGRRGFRFRVIGRTDRAPTAHPRLRPFHHPSPPAVSFSSV